MSTMKISWWPHREYQPVAEDDTASEKSSTTRVAQRRIPLPTVIAIVTVQAILWTASVFYLLRRTQGVSLLDRHFRDSEGNSYPAAEAVRYQTIMFGQDYKYMSLHGVPTSDTDDAWTALMGSTEGMIQASRASGFEMDRLPDTVASKINPDVYMYGLEVHHQLHCLNRIRQSFHPQHYFANETEQSVIDHREHCLDHIRQSVMCSGDFTLDRWQYDPADGKNWLKTDVPHVCRDFGALQRWQEARRPQKEDWQREDGSYD